MESPSWESFTTLVENSTDSSCFSTAQNTVLMDVSFGGVPVVLLLDSIVFLVLLLVFSCIRKKLWDYGRLALVAETEGFDKISKWRYGRMTSFMSIEESEHEGGVCSWLTFIIKMDDVTVQQKSGMDAVHYLAFQRHLIVLLLVVCVLSVSIILPVNLSGNLLGNEPYNFGRTTIGNLKNGDKLLWLHTVFAVLYLILTVALLRHHTSLMKETKRETARTTLFVCSVPPTASEDSLRTHFIEAYPSCEVKDVCLCYDVAKLMYLSTEKKRAEKNLLYYRKILDSQGQQEAINPRLCGHLCICCQWQGCKGIDAVDYYSSQVAQLDEEWTRHKLTCQGMELSLGMAFVTLQTESMAAYILKDFNALRCGAGSQEMGRVREITCCCQRKPQPSSTSEQLKVTKWSVSYATHPNNIYWQNLSMPRWMWWSRFLLLNISTFILLFFLTTPSIVISTIDKFNVTKPIQYLNCIQRPLAYSPHPTSSTLLPIECCYQSVFTNSAAVVFFCTVAHYSLLLYPAGGPLDQIE